MESREFVLQPALSYKERLEDICQLELAEIEAAYTRERCVLDLLSELETLGFGEIERRHALGRLDIGAIGVCLFDLQELQKRIEHQLLKIEELAEETRKKRERLIAISKEKKALEKLKEKHERKVTQALVKAEDKVMLDIATSQYHRRQTA